MLQTSSYLSALKSHGVLATHTVWPALAGGTFCFMYSGTLVTIWVTYFYKAHPALQTFWQS